MAWIDGTFVVIGGDLSPAKADPHTISSGFRLNSATGGWTKLAPAPVGLNSSAEHVVLGGVLYVVAVTYDHTQTKCESESFFSYELATDTWTSLPLPAGSCSLDPTGLLATAEAVVTLNTGIPTASVSEQDLRQVPIFPAAVDAVFDPAAKTWRTVTGPAATHSVRWAASTPSGVLVTVESLPPTGAHTLSAPALPQVYSWDYRTGAATRVDHPGSAELNWKEWTGRLQTSAGPIYFQSGRLLAFDAGSGTFRLQTPECGGTSCTQLDAGKADPGDGATDLALTFDGWAWGRMEATAAFLLRPATGETRSVVVPASPDPNRRVLEATFAGGGGVMLSCPLFPASLPAGGYVDDVSGTPAPLTQSGNSGTGQPGTLIRVFVDEPGEAMNPSVVAVDASGRWTYTPGSETNSQAKVQKVEYVHNAEMQPYCYLIR